VRCWRWLFGNKMPISLDQAALADKDGNGFHAALIDGLRANTLPYASLSIYEVLQVMSLRVVKEVVKALSPPSTTNPTTTEQAALADKDGPGFHAALLDGLRAESLPPRNLVERLCGYTPTPNPYRGTSLIRNTPPVGPYSSPMPRNLW